MADPAFILPVVLLAVAQPGGTQPWPVKTYPSLEQCEARASDTLVFIQQDNPDAVAWCAVPPPGAVLLTGIPALAPSTSPRPKARPQTGGDG